ncbi:MAG: amidohydrolase family protein [Phycisphaerales bacterium]|nr:amidohydrolase family protein [Phycisphaerales bacterium]
MTLLLRLFLVASVLFLGSADAGLAQLAVRGETVYTMAGPPIKDGVVLIRGGKIDRVGRASEILGQTERFRVLTAKVVTPGLIDAHTVVGFTGYLNQKQDQDQLERSEPIQPELRAIDGYNPQERLIEWVRGFGITTIHTGHAPGELISGQTMIAKTTGRTTEDAVIVPTAMIAATLGDGATKRDKKSPGTRSKAVAMLRAQLIKAREYLKKQETTTEAEDHEDPKKGKPDRNLRLEALGHVLKGEWPLMVTVHRAHNIATTLRIAKEFKIKLVLDGAAEAYLVLDKIKAAGVPVIVHPTMMRSGHGQTENASMETAAKLHAAGIPIAMQSGYESYVPKTRIVLFETAVAAANGLPFEDALAACTINAATLLGISDRVGTLELGKDADIALYDGDPFEYTTHCIGVVINGEIVSNEPR